VVMCIKSHNYHQVQDLLARHLPEGECDDPRKLQFTGQSSYSLKPSWRGPFSSSASSLTLYKMLRSQYGDRVSDTIYYEVLPYTLEEMKRKTTINARVYDLSQQLLYKGVVVVDRDATFGNLSQEVRKHCNPAVPEEQQLRVMQVSYSKVYRVLKDSDPVSALATRANPEVMVEFVSPDEAKLDKGDRLVPCVHAEHDYFLTPYGMPLMFVIRKKESIASIRARLGQRLHVPAEELEKWKFGVAVGGYATGFKELEDGDHADAHKWSDSSYFAMIHSNRRQYASRYGREQGVKIRDVSKDSE